MLEIKNLSKGNLKKPFFHELIPVTYYIMLNVGQKNSGKSN